MFDYEIEYLLNETKDCTVDTHCFVIYDNTFKLVENT